MRVWTKQDQITRSTQRPHPALGMGHFSPPLPVSAHSKHPFPVMGESLLTLHMWLTRVIDGN